MEPTTSLLGAMSPNHQAKSSGALQRFHTKREQERRRYKKMVRKKMRARTNSTRPDAFEGLFGFLLAISTS